MLRAGRALAFFAALVVSASSGDHSFAGDDLDLIALAVTARLAGPSRRRRRPVTVQNPLVALGQRLFFDTRLSGTGARACATCHNPGYGYAEPRWVSISDNGKLGRRNAPSLLDVAFLPRLMWDGAFHSLEQQAFGPFESGEMGIPIEEAARRVNADPQYAATVPCGARQLRRHRPAWRRRSRRISER